MADYSNLLKFLADNGEGNIPQQNYQLLEFLKANALAAPPAPQGASSVSTDPIDNLPADYLDKALSEMDGKIHLLNRSEAAPGNPMSVRADAITREHGKNGFKASVDSNGRMLIEGTGIAPAATPGQQPLATNLHGLYNLLRSTNDPDKARGIMGQANEALAAEQAKLFQQAQTFAQNKLQIPQLEQQLANEQALDRQAKDYVPGAGDSPITMRIRNALEDARGKANTEAQNFLRGNVSYNSLAAVEKNITNEATRISRLADKKDMLDARATEKRMFKQDELEQQAKGLMDEQKDRLRILHPQLAAQPDTTLVEALDQHRSKKDGYMEALEAPSELLPNLAALGNGYAKAIFAAKEYAAGVPQEVTNARIKELGDLSGDDAAIKRGMRIASQGIGDKELQAKFASFKALTAPGATPDSKKQYELERMGYAKVALADKINSDFRSDLSSWGIADPAIQQAIFKTQETVQKRDMQSVLNTYVGNATGPARQLLIANFTAQALKAADRTKGSSLGKVDSIKLRQDIETSETKDFLHRMMENIDAAISMNYASDMSQNKASLGR